MKEISILMSTFNPNRDYFCQCLDSIQNQTYKEFELILVDDGTTNCSLEEILSSYTFDYKIITNSINLGLPKSLNIGLKHCMCEYVARMDDDDIMSADRLQKQLAFCKRNGGLVFSSVNRIDLEGRKLTDDNSKDLDIEKYLRKSGNCLTHSSLFTKKSTLVDAGGYNEKFFYAQDYELYMRLLGKVRFYLLNDNLVTYRVMNNTSLSKRVLSLLYCYGAAVLHFGKHWNFENTFYFFRRSLSLVKQMYSLIREEKNDIH